MTATPNDKAQQVCHFTSDNITDLLFSKDEKSTTYIKISKSLYFILMGKK